MMKANSREGCRASDNIGSKQIMISRSLSTTTTTTTSSWSRLKDPRIVRVSRAFGGKDRHSKVCTVRGLRDRRVRLSVPTAIQLYDLQDRLGLNQPSKVVDWLLNAAKHEIDELPPLQMPPSGSFQLPIIIPSGPDHHHQSTDHKSQPLKMSSSLGGPLELSRSTTYWNNPDYKSKEEEEEEEVAIARDAKRDHEEGSSSSRKLGINGGGDDQEGTFVSSNNFFSRPPNPSSSSSSSVPAGLLNNTSTIIPNNSFLRWDPSNLSLSQFGTGPHQTSEDAGHGFNNHVVVPHHLPNSTSSSTTVPSGIISHQLLEYPPQTQSYFPSHSGEINFQMLSSSSTNSQNLLSSTTNTTTSSLIPSPIYTISQGMIGPFHLSMNPKYFPSDQINSNIENDQPNKDP